MFSEEGGAFELVLWQRALFRLLEKALCGIREKKRAPLIRVYNIIFPRVRDDYLFTWIILEDFAIDSCGDFYESYIPACSTHGKCVS